MDLQDVIITTDRKARPESVLLAEEISHRLNILVVERQNRSIAELKNGCNSRQVMIVSKNKLSLATEGGELFFHPNISQLRVKNLRLGHEDHMVEAMGLQAGMKVLDCTLGFGADSIVASYIVGEAGTVTGLEISPLVAEIIGYGLSHFLAGNYEMHAAMRRIKVVNVAYLDFLKKQADNSFDVVYFDPMFRYPIMDSKSLEPLRQVADHSALSLEAVMEAKRVAARRVVMKETALSQEFSRLGFTNIVGGRYSKIHYGVIDT